MTMTAGAAADVLDAFDSAGVFVVVDGGRAIDALLGETCFIRRWRAPTPITTMCARGCSRPTREPSATTNDSDGSAMAPFKRRRPASPKNTGASRTAAAAGSVSAIELDDLYDDATLARIERAHRPVSAGRRPTTPSRMRAGALALGIVLGVQYSFEPPERVEVEEVDPWTGGGRHPRVRLHWDPRPQYTIAEVLA